MNGMIKGGAIMDGTMINEFVMNEAVWFEVLLKLSVLHFSLIYC